MKQERTNTQNFFRLDKKKPVILQLPDALHQLQLQSVIVEGGAQLLQSFIDYCLWDEARIITNEELVITNGLDSPKLVNAVKISARQINDNCIEFYKPAL